jgi:hypothetical protein
MTSAGQSQELEPARRRIADALARGATLAEVEDRVIDRLALSRDARDALWLFAWSAVERGQIRRWARAWPR